MDFKYKKPSLVTVVLKLIEISLKPQLQTVILQFLLEPQLLTVVLKEVSLKLQLQTVVLQFPLKSQLVTVVLQLFSIRIYFNGVVILILFLKYFFIKTTIKPQLLTVVLLMVL